jgi:hypothetical protein
MATSGVGLVRRDVNVPGELEENNTMREIINSIISLQPPIRIV